MNIGALFVKIQFIDVYIFLKLFTNLRSYVKFFILL